jgi:predicted GNAT family N-acyltransferase
MARCLVSGDTGEVTPTQRSCSGGIAKLRAYCVTATGKSQRLRPGRPFREIRVGMVREQSTELGAIQYVHVVDGDTLAEIGRLRIAAWEADGSRPAFAAASGDSWIDPHDEHAHHWVIRWRDTIVASARMCIHSTLQEMPDCECLVGLEGAILLAAASLNRLVVHPSFRGMHLGPRFDQVRIAKAKQLGAAGTFGTTHAKGRLRDLNDAGFVLLAESPHRIVPQLPSFVLWKGFNSSEDLK